MERVSFVNYGTGFCDICDDEGYLVFIGVSEPKSICAKCLPTVIENMKKVGDLVQFFNEKKNV